MDDNPSDQQYSSRQLTSLRQLLDSRWGAIEITYVGGHSVAAVVDEYYPDYANNYIRVDCYVPNSPGTWATGYCSLIADRDGLRVNVGDPDRGDHPIDRTSVSHSVTSLNSVERSEVQSDGENE